MDRFDAHSKGQRGGTLAELCPNYPRLNVPGWPVDESEALHDLDHEVIIANGANSFYMFHEDGTYVPSDQWGDAESEQWYIDLFCDYLDGLRGLK